MSFFPVRTHTFTLSVISVNLVAETKGVSIVCSYDYWRMRGICYSYAVDNESWLRMCRKSV